MVINYNEFYEPIYHLISGYDALVAAKDASADYVSDFTKAYADTQPTLTISDLNVINTVTTAYSRNLANFNTQINTLKLAIDEYIRNADENIGSGSTTISVILAALNDGMVADGETIKTDGVFATFFDGVYSRALPMTTVGFTIPDLY